MSEKPRLVEIEISGADVAAVMDEFEADNPGKTALEMTPKEFADRMMKKVLARAVVLEGGSA